ncbi:MAG: C-terminal binding protein [Clostridia bacterium]
MSEVSFKAVVVDCNYWDNEGCFDIEQQVINEKGGELVLYHLTSEDDIIDKAKDADILLCCGNPPITRKVIENIKAKCIVRYGIGVNSVDLEAASEKGKVVYFMPGFCHEELVTHASALILSLLRNICYYDSSIRKGEWPKGKGPMPTRLSDMTVGLFGFGTSARPMADVFRKGFKSRVISCDPYMDYNAAKEHDVEVVTFDELLEQSDIVSLHAPLVKDTYHIFNKEAFKKMKKSSMIVNISRGPLINEEDLAQALANGEISCAGLDVFEKEPLSSDSSLRELNNTVFTPHSAFYGVESLKNMHVISAKLISDVFQSRIIHKRNVANKDILDSLVDYQMV